MNETSKKIHLSNKNHLPRRLVTEEDNDHNPPMISNRNKITIKNKTNNKNTNNKKSNNKNKSILKSNINKLYIITFNVRTLSTYEKLIELNEAIKNIKFDIIGLSETRRLGTTIEEYKNFIFCYTGFTQGLYGVGFLIKKCYKENIENFTSFSDRVALLNLDMQGNKLSLIQVYAPTESAKEGEIEVFYTNLCKAIDLAHKTYIIMGDFNAKIGYPKTGEYLIMKQYGYGLRNHRGQRLIDFAIENKVAILNTFFKKKLNRRWTWRSPSGEYKNEIDFILSNKPGMVQNIEVLNVNYPSDHRPVRATITLKKLRKSRNGFQTYQNSTLKNGEEINKYRKYITSFLPDLLGLPKNTSVQTYYDKIIYIITQSLKKARTSNSKTNSNKNNILSEKTRALIARRQLLQKTKNKTRSMKNKISAYYKLISKRIKYDYATHRTSTIEKHLVQHKKSF